MKPLPPPLRRRAGRLLVALLLAGGALVAFAPAASAHAELVSTDPADGSVVPKAPRQVTMTYSEGVSVTLGSVRVFDHTGKRVDAGDSRGGAKPSQVVVGLEPGLSDGTYLVAWRAISADTHPVHGGFVFSVGSKGALDKGVDQSLLGGEGDTLYQAIGAGLRMIGYGGLLLAVGGAVFLTVIGEAAGSLRSKLVLGGGIAGVVAGLLNVPVQAVLATGLGLSSVTNGDVLRQVLGDGVAWSLLLTAIGAGLLAWSTRPTHLPDRRIVAAGVVAVAVAFAVAGHPRTTDPTWLAMLSDAVHATAGGVWLGGLVLLGVTLRGRRTADDPAGAARAVALFSGTATWALAAVSGMGLILGYLEVKALSALTGTNYGRLLLIKVAVVAGVALLGAYNRYRLVPLVTGGSGDGPVARSVGAAVSRSESDSGGGLVVDGDAAQPPGGAAPSARTGWRSQARRGEAERDQQAGRSQARRGGAERDQTAWSRLRRIIRVEAAGLAVVVVLTGLLVNAVPARTAAGIGQVFSTTAAMGDRSVNLVVDPAQRGSDTLHLYLLNKVGQPVDDVQSMSVELTLPSKDLGPIKRELFKAGPGHFQINGLQFPLSGTWQVAVVGKVDRFTEDRATVAVPIR